MPLLLRSSDPLEQYQNQLIYGHESPQVPRMKLGEPEDYF